MKCHFPRIVVGSDVTGMVMAAKLDAIFIPVAFYPAYGWEHDAEYCPELLALQRNCLKRPRVTVRKNRQGYTGIRADFQFPEMMQILTETDTITPKMFYWEIEEHYICLLTMFSLLFDDWNIQSIVLNPDSLQTVTRYGYSDSITFDKCWIINPGSHFVQSTDILPIEIIESERVHILYRLKMRKETEDQQGITFRTDWVTVDDPTLQFNKLWMNKPFGKKQLVKILGSKPTAFTTKNITILCENVPIEDINDDIYDIYSIKKSIYRYFSPTHLRIKRSSIEFEKDIQKIILSTNVNMYENTDKIEFIYYEDKKEIINEENMNYIKWDITSPRIYYKIMLQHIYSTLTDIPIPKTVI